MDALGYVNTAPTTLLTASGTAPGPQSSGFATLLQNLVDAGQTQTPPTPATALQNSLPAEPSAQDEVLRQKVSEPSDLPAPSQATQENLTAPSRTTKGPSKTGAVSSGAKTQQKKSLSKRSFPGGNKVKGLALLKNKDEKSSLVPAAQPISTSSEPAVTPASDEEQAFSATSTPLATEAKVQQVLSSDPGEIQLPVRASSPFAVSSTAQDSKQIPEFLTPAGVPRSLPLADAPVPSEAGNPSKITPAPQKGRSLGAARADKTEKVSSISPNSNPIASAFSGDSLGEAALSSLAFQFRTQAQAAYQANSAGNQGPQYAEGIQVGLSNFSPAGPSGQAIHFNAVSLRRESDTSLQTEAPGSAPAFFPQEQASAPASQPATPPSQRPGILQETFTTPAQTNSEPASSSETQEFQATSIPSPLTRQNQPDPAVVRSTPFTHGLTDSNLPQAGSILAPNASPQPPVESPADMPALEQVSSPSALRDLTGLEPVVQALPDDSAQDSPGPQLVSMTPQPSLLKPSPLDAAASVTPTTLLQSLVASPVGPAFQAPKQGPASLDVRANLNTHAQAASTVSPTLTVAAQDPTASVPFQNFPPALPRTPKTLTQTAGSAHVSTGPQAPQTAPAGPTFSLNLQVPTQPVAPPHLSATMQSLEPPLATPPGPILRISEPDPSAGLAPKIAAEDLTPIAVSATLQDLTQSVAAPIGSPIHSISAQDHSAGPAPQIDTQNSTPFTLSAAPQVPPQAPVFPDVSATRETLPPVGIIGSPIHSISAQDHSAGPAPQIDTQTSTPFTLSAAPQVPPQAPVFPDVSATREKLPPVGSVGSPIYSISAQDPLARPAPHIDAHAAAPSTLSQALQAPPQAPSPTVLSAARETPTEPPVAAPGSPILRISTQEPTAGSAVQFSAQNPVVSDRPTILVGPPQASTEGPAPQSDTQAPMDLRLIIPANQPEIVDTGTRREFADMPNPIGPAKARPDLQTGGSVGSGVAGLSHSLRQSTKDFSLPSIIPGAQNSPAPAAFVASNSPAITAPLTPVQNQAPARLLASPAVKAMKPDSTPLQGPAPDSPEVNLASQDQAASQTPAPPGSITTASPEASLLAPAITWPADQGSSDAVKTLNLASANGEGLPDLAPLSTTIVLRSPNPEELRRGSTPAPMNLNSRRVVPSASASARPANSLQAEPPPAPAKVASEQQAGPPLLAPTVAQLSTSIFTRSPNASVLAAISTSQDGSPSSGSASANQESTQPAGVVPFEPRTSSVAVPPRNSQAPQTTPQKAPCKTPVTVSSGGKLSAPLSGPEEDSGDREPSRLYPPLSSLPAANPEQPQSPNSSPSSQAVFVTAQNGTVSAPAPTTPDPREFLQGVPRAAETANSAGVAAANAAAMPEIVSTGIEELDTSSKKELSSPEEATPTVEAAPKRLEHSAELPPAAAFEEPASFKTGPKNDPPSSTTSPGQNEALEASLETVKAALRKNLEVAAGRPRQIDIDLHPAHLGQVRIQISLQADGYLNSTLHVSNPEVADHITRHLEQFTRQLQDDGVPFHTPVVKVDNSNLLQGGAQGWDGGRQSSARQYRMFDKKNREIYASEGSTFGGNRPIPGVSKQAGWPTGQSLSWRV